MVDHVFQRPGHRIGHAEPRLEIAIVGAGLAGLAAGIKLLEAGVRSFTLYERADEIGGTWRDNAYPGSAADIASHLYSFSFLQNRDWSHTYPRRDEILEYMQRCADEVGLWQHIRFGTAITEMRWDDEALEWSLVSAAGDVFRADVVINSTGPLTKPIMPGLRGLADFGGRVFHSSEWPTDHDLAGRRVVVVGTGASAIQLVPEIAERVEHLVVFQRTAPWVLPLDDRDFTGPQKWTFKQMPLRQRIRRWKLYWRNELSFRAFTDNSSRAKQLEAKAEVHASGQLGHDAGLRSQVTPHHPIGCRRILLSNSWYPTLARDNVTLETSPIDRVSAGRVTTAAGAGYEADTIVMATGFSTVGSAPAVDVFGRRGVELSREWADGAATHLGIAVSGFPNFFMLQGPNTRLAHNSDLFMIESQVHYILATLDHLAASPGRAFDVLAGVQRASQRRLRKRMRRTVWSSGCDELQPSARPRSDMWWPGYSFTYWRRTRKFQPDTYALLS